MSETIIEVKQQGYRKMNFSLKQKIAQKPNTPSSFSNEAYITVSGADGKTTTSELIRHILNYQDKDTEINHFKPLFPMLIKQFIFNPFTASVDNTVVPIIKEFKTDFNPLSLEQEIKTAFVPHKIHFYEIEAPVIPD